MLKKHEVTFVPSEIRGLAALVLVCGSGTFNALRDLGFVIEDGAPSRLAVICPNFEIDPLSDSFHTSEEIPDILDISLMESVLSLKRAGEHSNMSDQARCFERLSAIAAHLIESGNPTRSIRLLRLVGQIVSLDRTIDSHQSVSNTIEPPIIKGLEAEASTGKSKTRKRKAEILLEEHQQVPHLPIPHLHVRLFGDIEIELDGTLLSRSHLHKGKVRTLFSLLVLNQGKGISRDTMIEWLWPDREIKKGLTGFYNLWSRMQAALPDNDGDSPYFSNDARLIRINPRYVSSDVADFDRLSRIVFFSQGSLEERFAAIDQLEQLYKNDVLSGSTIHPKIVATQERYRDMLIDVLLSASTLHLECSNNNMALWYARRALDIDPRREDTYRALMSVQEASGQRTQAMSTYHECRRFLDEELGVLPSRQTTELYLNLVSEGQ
ncbi:MAG: bacterial transcriptional activator domain-containing protein [Coriobacteriia bacterium]|nr:bacterial transcriptional activator domain-containing protein [Coriobacteriia bacterium]